MSRFGVDTSATTAVWVCWCGARGVAWDRLGGLRGLRAHEKHAHPGDRRALKLLDQYEQRLAARRAAASK